MPRRPRKPPPFRAPTRLQQFLLASQPVVDSPFLATHTHSDRLRVVLVNTRNPLNIGAAARAMSNFGFFHLRVVNPYELAFREARSAVGASPILAAAEEFPSLAEAVADCTLVVGTTSVGHRELQHPVKRLEQAAPLIRKRLAASRVALLFGSEKRGLSNEDLSHCHWLLRIPTREEHRSMNLGQAVAVCLYELARNSSLPSRHPESSEESASRVIGSYSGWQRRHPQRGMHFRNVCLGFMSKTPRRRKSCEALSCTFNAGSGGC
jgi:TrmH family RNA methyltransferase